MKHKKAYKISAALAIIGLTLMYASSIYIQIEEVDAAEIKSSWQGKNVVAEGEAVNVTRSDEHLFFDLKDETGSILVVDFNSRTSLSRGEEVEVTGKVEVYEGELEIIAEELQKVG